MSLWARSQFQIKDGDVLIVCLYVDDLIFIGNNLSMFEDFNKAMAKEFDMTDIGLTSYYLGIKVKQKEDEIFISQESYIKEILKKFNMDDCNPLSTPMEWEIKLFKDDEPEKDLWVITWRLQQPLILRLQREFFATSKVQ